MTTHETGLNPYINATDLAAQARLPANVGVGYYPASYQANNYYFCNSAAQCGTGSLSNNTIRATVWIVTAPITITRVFTELVTAGDANSVHRLGIYADNGAKPGVLLLDAGTISTGTGNAGTVATGGVAGIYEITCSLALQPGLYWAAGCQQGVTTTLPIMRVITAPAQATLMTSTASVPGVGSSIMGVSASPYSGALPSTLVGVSYSTIGSATRMGFRVGP